MKAIHEKFIRAKPFEINKTIIRLPSLEKIFDLEIDEYFEYLYSLVMDFDSIRGSEALNPDIYYSDYELFILILLSDEKFKETSLKALEFFTGDRFVFTEQAIVSARKKTSDGVLHPLSEEVDGEFVIYDILTEELWQKIREALAIAHWIPLPIERGPLKGKAAEIADKIRRNKEEVARIKAKQNKGNGSTEIYELIASIASRSPSYNLFNVWQLTYYQFFDQFKRTQLDEEYRYSLEQILAGVDPKKLEIRHWSSSILTQK